MFSKPRLLFKYVRYLITASNGKGHGVHSPFVYAFIRNVLKEKRHPEWTTQIEAVRKKWKRDLTSIAVNDLGGKGSGQIRSEPVSVLARRSLSSPKFGRLLFRISRYYQVRQLLELGTSLGLSGSYLIAGAGSDARLITIEGAEEVAALARHTFAALNLENVEVLTGDFALRLPELPGRGFVPDLVFIDGNHRKEPLLDYFNAFLKLEPVPRVIILHDIHWSEEMESGWQNICSMPEVMLSIDLFFAGILFFDDKFRIKQHFRIRF